MKILVIIGFFFWTLGASVYWICVVREGCSSETNFNSESNSLAHLSSPSFQVWNGGNLLLESPDSFSFGHSDSVAMMSPRLFSDLDSLVRYLYTSPSTSLRITGLESLEEQNYSSFSTLGLARAAHVSQLLLNQGIEEDRIQLSFQLGPKDSLFDRSDSLRGGIKMDLIHNSLATGPDQGTLLDSTYFNSESWNLKLLKPQILYFSEEDQRLIWDEEKRAFISQCIQYVRLFPEKKILLTGFSDDQNASVINVQWGLEKALKAKKYFQEFGLPGDRIDVLSLGAADPIASNDTEEGRSLNRRVELSIR